LLKFIYCNIDVLNEFIVEIKIYLLRKEKMVTCNAINEVTCKPKKGEMKFEICVLA